MASISRFSSITLPYTDLTTLSISLQSSYVKSMVETLNTGLYFTETHTHNNSVEVHPDMEWPSGAEITITLDGVTHKYYVPENLQYYAPIDYLYSNNLTSSSDPLEELSKAGLVTLEEKVLLGKLEQDSPKLFDLLYKISRGLIPEYRYNNTPVIKQATVLKGFRRLVQLLYMYGLDSVLNYYSLDIGPPKEWFLDAHIFGAKTDAEAQTAIVELTSSIKKLKAVMQNNKFNIDLLPSLQQHIDPRLSQYKLVETASLIILAMRYSDNGEFKY